MSLFIREKLYFIYFTFSKVTTKLRSQIEWIIVPYIQKSKFNFSQSELITWSWLRSVKVNQSQSKSVEVNLYHSYDFLLCFLL